MRIPLSESQYVGFFRDFETESSPLILSAFVSTVERGITRCLARDSKKEPAGKRKSWCIVARSRCTYQSGSGRCGERLSD